jgi:hypothetical protein
MRARSLLALVLVVLLSALMAPAASAVTLGSTINVTADRYAQNEESLGMNPSGTLLAAAWNDWNYNDGCGFSYSTDGGSTWAPDSFVPGLTLFTNDPDIPGTGSYIAAGDPAVAYNPSSGVFDVVCQAFGSQPSHINLLATTFDPAKADPTADVNESYGADAWSTPVSVATGRSNGAQKGSNGHFPDHESITIDTGTGPGHHFGRLFVTWAQFSGLGRSPIQLAYSDDDGRSWTGPISVSDKDHPANQDARVVVAPDGTLYDTFIGGPNETYKNNFIAAARSTDGGDTWGPTAEVAPVVAFVQGLLPNSDYRVSSDVTSSVDQSTGRLVMAFNDERTGASQVFATHQLHPGDLDAWSSPRRVSPSSREQFFPWMSAAPDGRLDLVFYDRTCDPGDTLNCVTLARSSDGGGGWDTTPVTSSGFDGDRFSACVAFIQPIDCDNPFLGDYIAVSSTETSALVTFTANGRRSQDVFFKPIGV